MNLAQRFSEAGAPGAEGLSTQVRCPGAGCQQGADTKVLRGKGAGARRLAQVVEEMEKLSGETKAVAGRAIFLEVHRRKSTGQTSLKWRLVPGGWRHVKWDDPGLQDALTRLGVMWQGWYQNVNAVAQRLNIEERMLRSAQREAGTHVDTSTVSSKC